MSGSSHGSTFERYRTPLSPFVDSVATSLGNGGWRPLLTESQPYSLREMNRHSRLLFVEGAWRVYFALIRSPISNVYVERYASPILMAIRRWAYSVE